MTVRRGFWRSLRCFVAMLLAGLAVSVPAALGDATVVAAGDIACGPGYAAFNEGMGSFGSRPQCHQKYTSDLFDSVKPQAVLALGDEQYPTGSYQNFQAAYDLGGDDGDAMSWGRAKAITRPVPGNHEYQNTDPATGAHTRAAGYFDYFNGVGAFSGPAGDRDKGYYSYDITVGARADGSPVRWHLVALNSECAADPGVAQANGWLGGCADASAQVSWLRRDLAASAASGVQCTLAYWHHPRFSLATFGDTGAMAPIWNVLYDAGADVVLSGHHHLYERFPQLDEAGNPLPGRGIREFIVGTGGRDLALGPFSPRHGLEAIDNTTFGVLELTLGDSSYRWRFLPDGHSGSFTDAGAGSCVTVVATITGGPVGATATSSPAFSFSVNEPNATTQCRLDAGPWQPCASRIAYGRLPDGPHVFSVRAVDPAGHPEPVPPTRSFTVDTTPPAVAVTTPQDGARVAGVVPLTAAVSDATGVARVDWTVDGRPVATASAAPWSSTWTTTSVRDGRHVLKATAVDVVGHTATSAPVRLIVHNDQSPPSVAVRVARRLRLQRALTRGVAARVRCSEACRVEARLVVRRSVARRFRVRRVVGRAHFPLRTGRRKLVVRLGPRARRGLATAASVRLTLRVTASDRSGNRRTVTRQVTLRRVGRLARSRP